MNVPHPNEDITSDGPGAFDFVQGDNSSKSQNAFWELVKGAVTPLPSEDQNRCLSIGFPGELTTMAGRRIREALRAKLISSGALGPDAYVVIAGPADTYGHYVPTREEYGVQRYEGASTIFGQFTLEAYIDKYSSLVPFLADSTTGAPASDPAPVDQISNTISLQSDVVFDAAPIGTTLGDVLVDVNTTPYHAVDTFSAQFVGANPRNNLRLESMFLTVDQLVDGQWRTVRSDSHPSTIYQWVRVSTVLGTSTVTISWQVKDLHDF
ncbi:hypothetical protein H2248_005715 [Termitomyces sp. 'cryptogamus']|nr:hypothetical protein H2248_005715 [Termitomyces sp. 'cryptogamus']